MYRRKYYYTFKICAMLAAGLAIVFWMRVPDEDFDEPTAESIITMEYNCDVILSYPSEDDDIPKSIINDCKKLKKHK